MTRTSTSLFASWRLGEQGDCAALNLVPQQEQPAAWCNVIVGALLPSKT